MGFREARQKAGFTVLEASRKLEVSTEAVYRWEDGTYLPSGKRLPEIAKLYGCAVDELLSDSTKTK